MFRIAWDIRSVADLGGTTTTIEAPSAFHFATPLELGETLRSAASRFRIGRYDGFHKFELSEVVLEGSFHLIRRGKAFVSESLVGLADPRLFRSLIEILSLIHIDDDDYDYIQGFNWTSVNYYHWLIQALPSIHACLSRHDHHRPPKLVLPELTRWQERSLSALGYGSIERLTIAKDCRVALPNLTFTDLLHGVGRTSRMVLSTLHDLKLAVGVSGKRASRIYVSRRDASHRKVTNEDEVADELYRRGFQIIVPGEFTFDEQVDIFHSARMVVGAHGAGVANVGFCVQGSLFYELIPLDHTDTNMSALAQMVGVRYAADGFEQPGTGWGGHRDMKVDMAALRTRLDQFAPRIAWLGWTAAIRPAGRRLSALKTRYRHEATPARAV